MSAHILVCLKSLNFNAMEFLYGVDGADIVTKIIQEGSLW